MFKGSLSLQYSEETTGRGWGWGDQMEAETAYRRDDSLDKNGSNENRLGHILDRHFLIFNLKNFRHAEVD